MQVKFAGADEAFIKLEVENGFYTTEKEVVRDAVRRLREQKEMNQLSHLRSAVAEGDADISSGHMVAYSPELVPQIAEEAKKYVIKNKKLKPDSVAK